MLSLGRCYRMLSVATFNSFHMVYAELAVSFQAILLYEFTVRCSVVTLEVVFFQLLAAHQTQIEHLMESQDVEKTKQQEKLKQKLAERRKAREEAFKKKKDTEFNKELLEQKKELAEAERNAVCVL